MTSNPCSATAAKFRYRHEAEMARGYLKEAGIPSALRVDDAGGAYPGIGLGVGEAQVQVREDDLREARRVLVEAGMAGGGEGS